MTTLDLVGKILQAIAGLAAFGLIFVLLISALDREKGAAAGGGFVASLRRGLVPRIILAGVFLLVVLFARLAYGAVPWMTKELTNWLIIIGVVGAVATALNLVVESALERTAPTVRSAAHRIIGAGLVAAVAASAPLCASGSVPLLGWVTPGLALAAAIIGWPLAGVLLASAALMFAPARIRRSARLAVWLLGGAVVVVAAIAAEGGGETVGAWPWGSAAGFGIVGLLGYLADADEESRPMLVFLVPAALLMTVGLIYPAIRTATLAFTDDKGSFNGLDNFIWMFTQSQALTTLANTVIWVIAVPFFATVIGLGYAVFIDKSRGEKFFKMLVFMPMAISFVGAGIIWGFMYAYRGPEQEQIGLVNALLTAIGQQPQQILQLPVINTLALIVVMIWIQTGFAMTVLSAAIKGVPTEQLEAASLDGANPWQRFLNVTLPGIRSSVVVVVTTISIATLKVFDIVRTMTGGNFDTSVIANEMYTQAFNANHVGRGAALALVLFLLVLPIVVSNIRIMQQQKAIR